MTERPSRAVLGACAARTRVPVLRVCRGDVRALRVPAAAAVVLASCAMPLPAVAQAAPGARSTEPLPASNYAVRRVCGPPAPGYASCLALRLLPASATARARTHPLGLTRRRPLARPTASEAAYGLRPKDLHGAYALPAETAASGSQTIALVDAYDDPTAEQDLAVYSREFGLPECTRTDGCFTKVNQAGSASPLPETEGGWASESSLDIEMAHAICENCHILLVEASTASVEDLEAAEQTAVRLGATEISNSWDSPEEGPDSAAFDHPRVVITAAAGDYGYLNWDAASLPELETWAGYPDYPASSPHVVAVGGTRLEVGSVLEGALERTVWRGETMWNDGSTLAPYGEGASGGGCSGLFAAQTWQRAVPDWTQVGCAKARAVVDVAADGDPYTGVAVYDSTPEVVGGRVPEWTAFGGTSVASPVIAATFALAGGAQGVEYPAQTLYGHLGSGSLHDVTSGSNARCERRFNERTGESGCSAGEEAEQCSMQLICLAAAGFDGPSGVGTPDGIEAFTPPGAPVVSSLSPAAGDTGGGTIVTIKGANLQGPSAVYFGAALAPEVTALSGGELRVRSPAGSGEVPVSVKTAGGTSALSGADLFTYREPLPPSVSGVAPAQGATAGGTAVTITGANLEEIREVRFGEAAATGLYEASPNEITVSSPGHAAGEVDVTVVTAGGSSARSSADRFTYVASPVAPSGGAGGTGSGGGQAGGGASSGPGSAGTGPGGGRSAGPSGASAASAPSSRFRLLGSPRVNHRTGAIIFKLAVLAPGTLSFSLTFRNGTFGVIALRRAARRLACSRGRRRLAGRCRPRAIVFAKGTLRVAAAGRVTISVRPRAAARRALAQGAARGRSLTVAARLTYRATGATVAASRLVTVLDRLRALPAGTPRPS